jgi:hypothetical protein
VLKQLENGKYEEFILEDPLKGINTDVFWIPQYPLNDQHMLTIDKQLDV